MSYAFKTAKFGNGLLAEVILGRAETACGNYSVGAFAGDFKGFFKPFGVIADNGCIVYVHTKLA